MNASEQLPAGEHVSHFTSDQYSRTRCTVHRAAYTPRGMQDKPHPQTTPPPHQERRMPDQKREERTPYECLTKEDSATRALTEKRYYMQKDRLNLYLSPALCSTIRELAGNEDERISKVAEELLELGLSVKRGERLERESLPVIRNIVQTELHKAHAQLRLDLREDMQLEFTNEIKALMRVHTDRLAALIVRTFRHANITQRLAYALLSKSHGIDFARHAFEDASEKAGRDLAARPAKEGERA